MGDPRPSLFRAAEQIGALVTPDLDLDAPTPCTGWTVDDLLAHVLTVHHRALRLAPDDRPVDVPHQTHRSSLEDYTEGLAAARTGMRAAGADGAVLEQLPAAGREPLPFGSVVEVPDDAGPYDRLVGWVGRDPAVTVTR